MNKADIINKVHEDLGVTKADAERAVETVISCVVGALKDGNEVSIAGLVCSRSRVFVYLNLSIGPCAAEVHATLFDCLVVGGNGDNV